MKICYISDLYPPHFIGGAENYLYRLVRTISKHAEVVVINASLQTRVTPEITHEDGVKIYRFYPLNLFSMYDYVKKPFLLRYLWHICNIWNPHSYHSIKVILSKEKPDVVHTHNFKCLSASIFSAVESCRYPHVHTIHDYNLISPWTNLIRAGRVITRFNLVDKIYVKYMQLMTRSVSTVISPSKFAMHLHHRLGLFRQADKRVIPNGIEWNSKQIRKNYREIEVLYVGNMTFYKGVDVLINAFKRCRNQKLRLHLVGGGPAHAYLKDIAQGDKRITFHGVISDQVLDNLYIKSSFLVVPSLWFEVLPVVIQEAMSRGTPVVASAIGGIPDLIIDGFNGFLFKPGCVEDLARLIEKLAEQTHILSELSKNCLKFIKSFDMKSHAELLLKLYETIIKHRCEENS